MGNARPALVPLRQKKRLLGRVAAEVKGLPPTTSNRERQTGAKARPRPYIPLWNVDTETARERRFLKSSPAGSCPANKDGTVVFGRKAVLTSLHVACGCVPPSSFDEPKRRGATLELCEPCRVVERWALPSLSRRMVRVDRTGRGDRRGEENHACGANDGDGWEDDGWTVKVRGDNASLVRVDELPVLSVQERKGIVPGLDRDSDGWRGNSVLRVGSILSFGFSIAPEKVGNDEAVSRAAGEARDVRAGDGETIEFELVLIDPRNGDIVVDDGGHQVGLLSAASKNEGTEKTSDGQDRSRQVRRIQACSSNSICALASGMKGREAKHMPSSVIPDAGGPFSCEDRSIAVNSAPPLLQGVAATSFAQVTYESAGVNEGNGIKQVPSATVANNFDKGSDKKRPLHAPSSLPFARSAPETDLHVGITSLGSDAILSKRVPELNVAQLHGTTISTEVKQLGNSALPPNDFSEADDETETQLFESLHMPTKAAQNFAKETTTERRRHRVILLVQLGRSMSKARVQILASALRGKDDVTLVHSFHGPLTPSHIIVDEKVSAPSVASALGFSDVEQMARRCKEANVQIVTPEWLVQPFDEFHSPTLDLCWLGLHDHNTKARKKQKEADTNSGWLSKRRQDHDFAPVKVVKASSLGGNTVISRILEKKKKSSGSNIAKRKAALSTSSDLLASSLELQGKAGALACRIE